MTTAQIISFIDAEITRLQSARNLLSSETPVKRGRGRPKSITSSVASVISDVTKPARKTRVLSDEAKARIAAAQKKRWAKQKGAAKKAPAKKAAAV